MKNIQQMKLRGRMGAIMRVLLIGVIVFMMFFAFNQKPQEVVAWNSVDFTQDVEGTYIKGNLYMIYNWYLQEVNGENIVAYEYLIDADEKYYMGLRVQKNEFEQIEELLQATEKFMDNQIDEVTLLNQKMEVYGKIEKMSEERLASYHEALGWDNLSDEEKELFLPYYLDLNESSVDSRPLAFICLLFAVIMFSIAGAMVVFAYVGKDENIERYIASSDNKEIAKEKVNFFISQVPQYTEVYYNDEFIIGQHKGNIAFGELSKIVWLYKKVKKIRIYFIPIYFYSIAVGFADGKIQEMKVSDEETANSYLLELQKLCPKAILGYSDELAGLYEVRLKQFLELKYLTNNKRDLPNQI